MSKIIDGYALILSLTDWWYSSFGEKETEKSKAIKAVIDKVEKYVEKRPLAGIIRCKDCNKYDSHGHRCKHWNHGVDVMDFCSKGEERDG